MSVSLSTYLSKIRKSISDKGRPEHEEFLGDASSVDFYLTMTPIKEDSVSVYLDGTITTAFTLDYDSGKLTFTTAPGSDVVIKVLYTSYILSDIELIEYLETAIIESENYLDYTWILTGTAPDTIVDSEPTEQVIRIWILLLQINLKEDSTFVNAEKSIGWSTEGMSVNRTSIVRDSIASIKQLQKRLNLLVYYINSTATFSEQVMAAGYVPDSWPVEVGEFYIPEDKYQR